MYTIKINDDNSVITTVHETIMEKSNYVDTIQILCDKFYKNQIDMTDSTLYMKYLMPVSKKIKMTQLTAVDINYKNNYIQYKIPADAYLTAEPGNIEVSFTFIKLTTEPDGSHTSYIRKTEAGSIKITPLAQFDSYEPNEMFSEIDQRILMLEAIQKDLAALNQSIYDEMVRDIRINDQQHKLILTNKDGDTGTGVDIMDLSKSITTDIIGVDPDNVQDGVIHIDDIEMLNLDNLLK